jgi:5-methylcytosine-specific restriction endonuclease McrA
MALSKKDWYQRVYLQSIRWRQIRVDYLRRVGWKCERCHVRASRIVHHLNYDRLYYEQPEDLIALCNECHAAMHDRPKAANDNQYFLDLIVKKP